MKKLFFVILFCLCGCLATFAQTTKVISGAVIDKQGNPLPGAMVAVPNGADGAVVDADGTFSIEVPIWSKSLEAQYAGMKDKKMKIKDEEMIFRMKPAAKNQWFINAVCDLGVFAYERGNVHLGLMAGYLGKWGGYLKVAPSLVGDELLKGDLVGLPSVTAGVTKRFCNWLHMYLGLGAAPYWYCGDWGWDPDSAEYGWLYEDRGYSFAFEVGFMIKPTKHFNINVGFYCNDLFWATTGPQFGLGYSF